MGKRGATNICKDSGITHECFSNINPLGFDWEEKTICIHKSDITQKSQIKGIDSVSMRLDGKQIRFDLSCNIARERHVYTTPSEQIKNLQEIFKKLSK
jgi:hypothetical protein